MKFKTTTIACAVIIQSVIALPSYATLSTSYSFNGNGNWSLDGCGSNDTPTCSIDAIVPNGSTVEAAFLYSTNYVTNLIPTVSFDGTVYSGADWTALGPNASTSFLEAFRVDVTAQVAATIGSGSAAPYSFTVDSETPNTSIDGEVLAIVYSNPSEVLRTIAFLDGSSSSAGDSAFISLADPLTSADLLDPNFEASLSLGIGFGFQGNDNSQSSTVDVNGSTLTTCAGGSDDGIEANGGLITIGGIGDNVANDHDCSALNGDDELYSLDSFLSAGDSLITIDTLNPSNDDNIFFAGLNITADATISENPVTEVPAPQALTLLGLGLLGLGFRSRAPK
ncbi:MAG: hypothetical protein ABJH06_10715 [Paraglaciecola sp.]|uniref:hypothetical protein n=1 Tax=Paraglaciecola sp. TaxID=1920173 RepID=UPI0032653D09